MQNIGQDTLSKMESAVWYNKWLIDRINKYIKGDVLEIGSGTGNMSNLIIENCRFLTLTDINYRYLKLLKKQYKNRAEVKYLNIENNILKDRKYDCLIMINVLEHIKNDSKVIQNALSMIKNNGYLVLLVPAHSFLYSKLDSSIGHFRRYDLNDVNRLFTNYELKIEKLQYINWLGAIGWFIFIKLLNANSMPKGKVKVFDYLARIMLFVENLVRIPFGLSVLAVVRKK